MFESGPRLFLAVLAGRAKNEQQFKDLGIGECLYALFQKLILKALPVSGSFFLPILFLHPFPLSVSFNTG
jgi:hypothetical protein